MKNNDNNKRNNENNVNQFKWLHTLLSIPKIGELLTTVIAIVPIILISLLFSLLFSLFKFEELDLPNYLSIVIFVSFFVFVLIVSWWWLNYLERKIFVAILLPIPFIKIPVKWILYPFMLPIFGIQTIYRHFTTKPSFDNNSLDILENENEL